MHLQKRINDSKVPVMSESTARRRLEKRRPRELLKPANGKFV